MSTPIKICIVPEYPMGLMHGGLQVQALETFEALNALGPDISAELFDWSHGNPEADLYHFIGFPPYLSRVAELVAKASRPYVITVLLGGPQSHIRLRIAAAKRKLKLNPAAENQASAIQNAEALIVITGADKEAVRKLYPASGPIHIVPHGILDHFAHSSADLWHRQFGDKPFVLCVGAIQPRKNQLALVKACNSLRLPVVLLGPVLAGCQEYGNEVETAMKQNEPYGGQWLTALTNDDPLLHSAYAATRLFVLLSELETQPLSVMQAMAARKPILLLQAQYTQDSLFRGLQHVASTELETVQAALKSAWEQPSPTELPEGYSWPTVASSLWEIYKEVIKQAPRSQAPH